MRTISLNVKGMHCSSCCLLIKEALEELGVNESDVSHEFETVTVTFDESDISQQQIINAITREGYEVV